MNTTASYFTLPVNDLSGFLLAIGSDGETACESKGGVNAKFLFAVVRVSFSVNQLANAVRVDNDALPESYRPPACNAFDKFC